MSLREHLRCAGKFRYGADDDRPEAPSLNPKDLFSRHSVGAGCCERCTEIALLPRRASCHLVDLAQPDHTQGRGQPPRRPDHLQPVPRVWAPAATRPPRQACSLFWV